MKLLIVTLLLCAAVESIYSECPESCPTDAEWVCARNVVNDARVTFSHPCRIELANCDPNAGW